jgi:hypothetical protein
MRALYFLLAGAAGRFRYLRPGLAVILGGVAVKLLLADVVKFPAWSAPAFIAAVLGVVAAASLLDNRRARGTDDHPLAEPASRGQAHAEARGALSRPGAHRRPAAPDAPRRPSVTRSEAARRPHEATERR